VRGWRGTTIIIRLAVGLLHGWDGRWITRYIFSARARLLHLRSVEKALDVRISRLEIRCHQFHWCSLQTSSNANMFPSLHVPPICLERKMLWPLRNRSVFCCKSLLIRCPGFFMAAGLVSKMSRPISWLNVSLLAAFEVPAFWRHDVDVLRVALLEREVQNHLEPLVVPRYSLSTQLVRAREVPS